MNKVLSNDSSAQRSFSFRGKEILIWKSENQAKHEIICNVMFKLDLIQFIKFAPLARTMHKLLVIIINIGKIVWLSEKI